MDPFSLAVGISGLVALTTQTLKLTRTYLHGVRTSSRAAAALSEELETLQSTLTRLREFLSSEKARGHAFSETSVLLSSTGACQSKLKLLIAKLNAVGGSKLSRALWPLSEKEHQQSVSELRSFSQWIQFALTIDSCLSSLLSETSSNVMEILGNQLEACQTIRAVESRTSTIEKSLKEQAQGLQNDRDALKREEILKWISSFEHEKKHHAIRTPRVEGTGQWLLDRPEFQSWRDDLASDRVLWCHGIQGSGKSVCCSLVIDHLMEYSIGRDCVVAYAYFDYRDQDFQSSGNVTASILNQVAATGFSLPTEVVELHEKCKLKKKKTPPTAAEIERMLVACCQDFDRVFIVIDALDECDEIRHRRDFIRALETLAKKREVRLFITSRSYPEDIKRAFESASKITVKANGSDLKMFIAHEIDNSDVSDLIDEEFKANIVRRILGGAQDMFILPALQIQAILNEPTPGEMQDALAALPTSLHGAFSETVARIQRQPEGRRRLAMNTLLWISHARRPLQVQELSDALAIRPGQAVLNSQYRPSQKLMVECCMGLVVVDEQSQSIRLVHYTVQEYFREKRKEIFPNGNEEIAGKCLTYLLFDAFAGGCCALEGDILDRMDLYPFLSYCSNEWGNHVRDACSDRINEMALYFLRCDRHRANSIQIYQYLRGVRQLYWEPVEVNSVSQLHTVCFFGLDDIAKSLIDSGKIDVNAPSHIGTTPVIRAAAAGHPELVRMLLQRGADPTLKNWYGNALGCAAEAGHCNTIQELLDFGMDVNIRDDVGRTALHCAADDGHEQALRLLVERGADTEALDGHGLMPWHAFAEGGHMEAIHFLLGRGFDPDRRCSNGLTALHYAAGENHVEVIYVLIVSGADLDARTPNSNTPLHYAVRYAVHQESENAVKLLLSAGADVHAEDNEGFTAHFIATSHGSDSLLALLEAFGAKPSIPQWVPEWIAPDRS